MSGFPARERGFPKPAREREREKKRERERERVEKTEKEVGEDN